MAEPTVKIVKVRGKGAGKESMTEIPESTWNQMNKDVSSFPDVKDWKVVAGGIEKAINKFEIKEKTEEEIIEEAKASMESSGNLGKPDKKDSKK